MRVNERTWVIVWQLQHIVHPNWSTESGEEDAYRKHFQLKSLGGEGNQSNGKFCRGNSMQMSWGICGGGYELSGECGLHSVFGNLVNYLVIYGVFVKTTLSG